MSLKQGKSFFKVFLVIVCLVGGLKGLIDPVPGLSISTQLGIKQDMVFILTQMVLVK